ncbi:FKBP-type peptidyl-prolyl cis-trans isomerase [Litoribaculum gwangyangense]|uniref:peptidylprolyl isomerase n=1 Tax=Litoribaculum gwangyangense TaxID=1130722 RepID=A0ABP9CUQ6_9FLAO
MTLRKVTFFILILIIGVVSCKKDDDSLDIPVVEIRDRTEQQLADKDSILKYLNNHYYNSDEVNSLLPNVGIKDIVINKLLEGETEAPVGSTLLINASNLETKTVTYADTEYEYYILRINQGGGLESPTFADNVLVNYEGFTLADDVFDSSVSAVPFDLTEVISAWRRVIPEFNVAESFSENGDGTISYSNQGTGVMIIPSGLGYFSNATAGIPSYSPLIFKFELYKMSQNDHDSDGIPSYLEDLNGDGEFIVNFQDLKVNTDDDSDGDGTPDYFDSDDDGDGILTIYEDINKDGNPTNDDSNGNGIPNYLDPNDIISNKNS